MEILARVANVLEVKFDKQVDKPAPCPPTEDVMLFSDSMKRWRKDFSIKEQFVRYFVDQCHRGYELEKNSAEFKKNYQARRPKSRINTKDSRDPLRLCFTFAISFPTPHHGIRQAWSRGNGDFLY